MLWSLVAIVLHAGHPCEIARLGTWQSQAECLEARAQRHEAAAYVSTYHATLSCEPRG